MAKLFSFEGVAVRYPLSQDEHSAMARYLSGIRKQLQDVSELFAKRYGTDSDIAELAVKALVSSTLLEHELMLMQENENDSRAEAGLETVAASTR